MGSADYNTILKRTEGFRRLYSELDLETSYHPFMDTYLDKAVRHLEKAPNGLLQRYVIESLYIEGKTPKQTAGPMGVTVSTVETMRKEAIHKLRNLCRYPWLL